MSFKEMKVSSKIIIGFSSIIAFALMVGAVGIFQMKKIDTLDTTLYEKGAIPLGQLGDLVESYQRVRINLRDIIRAKDGEHFKKFNDRISDLTKKFHEDLKMIDGTMMTDAGKKIVHDLETASEAFFASTPKIIEFAKEGKSKEAYNILDTETYQANIKIQEGIESFPEDL